MLLHASQQTLQALQTVPLTMMITDYDLSNFSTTARQKVYNPIR